ncbi:MAG: hypothetical protein LBR83_08410 [Clostridiales bacterium]|jgi:galactose mutarotase-like enzyme|nr:hypothetical protein [Clostridiales bacterium]
MARFLEIRDGGLTAQIAPYNGGMVTRLTVGGADVLHFDADKAELAPVSSGGAPVMFPFCGKIKDDAYMIDGREYYMPMLGLVKNAAFAVKGATENSVTLWCDNSASQKAAHYPFDFLLELEYTVAGDSLFATARVTNKSERPMPHYMGWHPYFKATDKAALKFEHHMTKHYDCANGRDNPAITKLDLSKPWDDVFHTPARKEFTLYNKPDGYRARCVLDDAHNVIVVYTGAEGAVCLEAWCGLPDSVNIGRFVKYALPGETERYSLRLEVEKI